MDVLTKLPTDNLYVFMTLIGLLMLVAIVWAITTWAVYYFKKVDEVKGELDKLSHLDDFLKKRSQFLNRLFQATIVTAYVLIFLGFGLWYWKHQSYQDRLVQLEVQRAELQLQLEEKKLDESK